MRRTFHCGHTGEVTDQTDWGLCQDCIDKLPKLPATFSIKAANGKAMRFKAPRILKHKAKRHG